MFLRKTALGASLYFAAHTSDFKKEELSSNAHIAGRDRIFSSRRDTRYRAGWTVVGPFTTYTEVQKIWGQINERAL